MKLKSYTCGKCGGVLNVEKSQRILDCPFCQNSFRSASFHRDEILKQAAANLRRKEFSSAGDKYREILEYEPENYDGLLGNLLSIGKVPSVAQLSDIRNASKYNVAGMLDFLKSEEIDDSSISAPYFEKLTSLLKKAQRYKALTAQLERIRKENQLEFENITGEKNKRDSAEENVTSFFELLGLLLMALAGGHGGHVGHGYTGTEALIFLGIVVLMVLITVTDPLTGTLAFLILFGFILVMGQLAAKNTADKHQKKMDVLREKTTANHSEFMKIDEEMNALASSYAEGYPELRKLRPQGASALAVSQERLKRENPEVFSLEEKKVFCAKCGAPLVLDRGRSLYACKFCGVASGASLFIGNVFDKAQKALSEKEFEEAEICFAHSLMMKPDDFDSLFGRILAEGRWTSLQDFMLDQGTHIPPFRVRNLLTRIEEAETHAKEEDRKIFMNMKELVNIVPRAEVLFKESRRTKEEAPWFEEKNRFDIIWNETNLLVYARSDRKTQITE